MGDREAHAPGDRGRNRRPRRASRRAIRLFFFSSRRRHTRSLRDWSSDVCSSDLQVAGLKRAFNAMVREVRESRDRIVYLEKISGWQEVARRLAHEIKNPLTPMKLAFQQLEARWRKAPGDPEFGKL